MAERIAKHMAYGHTKFIRGAVPTKLEKNGEKIKAFWKTDEGQEQSDEFDTVMFAIGRYAVTAGINCEAAGVKTEKNGKFIVNKFE